MITGRQVLAHGEPQPRFLRGSLPKPDDISPGTDRTCVPAWLVRGLPQVEPIVMHGHAAEISRSRFLVERDQVLGIELIGFPGGDDILKSELGGMAVVLDLIFVLPIALDLHVARVPVAVLGRGLRAQCARMPNLGSRYQLGICQSLSDSRVPLKGPGVISNWTEASARANLIGGALTASNPIACLRLSMRFLSYNDLPRTRRRGCSPPARLLL